jgi:hypothetical protein
MADDDEVNLSSDEEYEVSNKKVRYRISIRHTFALLEGS